MMVNLAVILSTMIFWSKYDYYLAVLWNFVLKSKTAVLFPPPQWIHKLHYWLWWVFININSLVPTTQCICTIFWTPTLLHIYSIPAHKNWLLLATTLPPFCWGFCFVFLVWHNPSFSLWSFFCRVLFSHWEACLLSRRTLLYIQL